MTNDGGVMKLRGMPAEAGMGLVLLALAVFFSVATVREQPSTGAAAAPEVVKRIVGELGKGRRFSSWREPSRTRWPLPERWRPV